MNWILARHQAKCFMYIHLFHPHNDLWSRCYEPPQGREVNLGTGHPVVTEWMKRKEKPGHLTQELLDLHIHCAAFES